MREAPPHPLFHSLTQNELVDLPVLEVLLEDEGAHVRVEVEHAGAVDVQDGVEAVPVPVEEELCTIQTDEVMSFNAVPCVRHHGAAASIARALFPPNSLTVEAATKKVGKPRPSLNPLSFSFSH